MKDFEFLNYKFPLSFTEFKKYLEDTDFIVKEKNRIIAFSLRNRLNAFAICDNDIVKYVQIRFLELDWNEKNIIVKQLEKYTLISHSIATNTRIYEKYNISFVYSDNCLLEATFYNLNVEEEKLKNKINKKLNSSNSVIDILYLLTALLGSN